MSIRWIRNVVVDGQQTTLEVMLGNSKIADKCYVRVNQDDELWFHPRTESREAILKQGLDMLKERLQGRQVTGPGGTPFTWH
jgi:hypothetical protein